MREYSLVLFCSIILTFNACCQRSKFDKLNSYDNEFSIVGRVDDTNHKYAGFYYSRVIKKFKKRSSFIDLNMSNCWEIYNFKLQSFRFSDILNQLSVDYNKQINDYVLSGGFGSVITNNSFTIDPAIDLNVKKTNFIFKRTNLNVGLTIEFHPGRNYYIDSIYLKNIVIPYPGFVPSLYADIKNWYFYFNIKIGRYF